MNLNKIGKVFTSKFVGTGPSSYKKRIYRAAVSQRLRNTALQGSYFSVRYSVQTSCNVFDPQFIKCVYVVIYIVIVCTLYFELCTSYIAFD